MPIPLLRFPLLVLDEVIETMGLQQLFMLSLCSKRMHLVFKRSRGKPTETRVTLTDNISIHITDKKEARSLLTLSVGAMPEGISEGWTMNEYRGVVFPADRDLVRSYWEDVEVGTRRLLDHVCDLFSAQVETVLPRNDSLWILDVVEQRQGPRSYDVECFNSQLSDEQFRHVLVDLNPYSMILWGVPSEQFRIENFQKTYDKLCVMNGNWVTGQNLLTLDCVELMTPKTTFTAAEINRFFRHVLIEGGAPRLTEFRAQVESYDANAILDGITEVLTPIPGREQFENNELSWNFSGLLDRGGRSVMATITCFKYLPWFIRFSIEQ